MDREYATECQDYADRRGYPGPALILRSWDIAHGLILKGWAQVVIVARYEHCKGAAPIRPEVVEAAGLTTIVILANRRRRPGGRHRAPDIARRTSNERPMPPPGVERLINERMRRWRADMAAWRARRGLRSTE